jgi:hypothetical protein
LSVYLIATVTVAVPNALLLLEERWRTYPSLVERLETQHQHQSHLALACPRA